MTSLRTATLACRSTASLAIAAPVALVALVALCGCGRGAPTADQASAQKPKVAHSEAERGPVKLSVTVDPSPARLSDEPTLTLEIQYPAGITVRKPEFGSALGEFVIRDFREPLPRVKDDRQILQQIYTIEPTRAGKIVIDPIGITFTDRRAQGDGKQHTLQTEPLTVEVAAAVAGQAPSLAELRPAAEPLPLAESSAVDWWSTAALAGVAVVVVAGAIWWLRRRRVAKAGPPPTPAELAFLELQRLREKQQIRPDVKLFYVELTAIVRRYIERTTGIRAPEQTTQEFLREISRRREFPAEESHRLMSFLEAADLVKFAAHQPRQEDVEESFRRATVFVGCAGRGGGGMSIRFQDPLWLLLLVALGVIGVLAIRRQRRAAVLYSDVSLLRTLPATMALRIKRALPWVRLAGLALVITALARPQHGTEEFRIHTEGIAIQMCIDRSGSMAALDFNLDGEQVNRLAIVKRVFRDFVLGRGSCRAGPTTSSA